MEQVELKVKVVDAELGVLEQRVNALKSTTLNIKTSSSGTDAAAKSLKNYSSSAEAAAKSSDTLMSSVSKFTTWYLIGGAVSGAIRSFKDAIETMKAVDDQLVVVRKVTGATTEEMKRLEEQAYKTASAYGVAADQYLESVAAFSRAGYGDQAAALAELAVKTQLVGDVSQETANQFLLSVDKAYQLNGSISELSKVLDGANEIDNKYATSIEKIASGLGTVAPVAAQAHVSIGELTAAIGTITAVTQRSGSEAARAFRALVLNILGDTKTEIDEGVTWTTGEIAGLRDVIKLYAPDAYEAAKATGTLIDPMEAIGGLAQSMQDGLLTEEKLMAMVSDIGGKLRTSQLLALIQNWDMYQSMLADYGDALGSADREVQNALDSWTRKTQILKNTWAEFINGLIKTDLIKGGLDALIKIVDVLDSDFGHFAITVGTVTLAVGLLSKGLTKVGAIAAASTLIKYINGVARGSIALDVAMKALNATLFSSPLFWAAAGAAAIYGIVEIMDALTVTTEELREELDGVNSQLEQQESEYKQLSEKDAKELTDEERVRLSVLEEQTNQLKEQRKIVAAQTLGSYKSDGSGQTEMRLGAPNTTGYSLWASVELTNEEYAQSLLAIASAEDTLNVLTNEQRISLSEYAEELLNAKDAGVELTESDEALLRVYQYLIGQTNEYAKAESDVADSANNAANSMLNFSDKTKPLAEGIRISSELATKMALADNELADSMSGVGDEIEFTLQDFSNLSKQSDETKQAIYRLIAEQKILNNSTLNLSQQIAEVQKLGMAAGSAAAMVDYLNGVTGGSAGRQAQLIMSRTGVSEAEANAQVFQKYLNRYMPTVEETTTPAGGGGGSKKDAELENRKAAVELLKSELSIMEKRGDKTDAQIGKLKQIRAALQDEIDYLRSIGGSEADINGLLADQYDIQNDILKLQKEQLDAVKELIENYYDAQNDALKEQRDALEEARDAEKDRLSLAEKQLAVEKAKAALANAQKERTVRQYNASTGQWEWVADTSTVEKAKKDYQDALDDLQDFEDELEYQTKRAGLEQKIDYNDKLIEKIDKAMQAFIDAVSTGSKDTDDAFKQLIKVLENANGLSDELRRQIYQSLMEFNSQAWFSASDEMKDQLHAYNEQLAELIGNLEYNEKTGEWKQTGGGGTTTGGKTTGGTTTGGTGGSSKIDVISQMRENSEAWHSASAAEQQALSDANRALGESMGWSRDEGSGIWYDANGNRAYDSGGVLTGLGGIKATRENEIVLPPDITKKMLTPTLDAQARDRFAELRYLYCGAEKPSGTAGTSIGSQQNGDIYNMNGYTLTESQAKSTTVYDFVRMSRGLKIYNSTN